MSSRSHYIHAGWLIDGSGEPIKNNVLLSIKAGIVTAVESFNGADRPAPEVMTDLSNCGILPPLIDSHVHLCMSGTISQAARKEQLTAGCEQLLPVITEHLSQHFAHGVLGVRDAGDRQGCILRYRHEGIGKEREPVLVKAAGRAYHKRGRYGALIGGHPAEEESLVEAYARNDQAVDQVKVVNSGLNSLSVFASETLPQFRLNELREIVSRARKQGRKVMVHANGELPVRAAIEAGCDSIEHGFFMGGENLELMAQNQTFWVPTAYTMKACAQHIDHYSGPADRAVVERNLAHQIEQLAAARQYGVKIALGTDAGSIGVLHGESVVEELKLLLQAGYSLVEAIRCATEHGAQLLGLDSELGQIRVGKPAHFLVARGTPAQMPRKLSFLEGVYLDGLPSNHYRKFYRDQPDHRKY